MKKNGQYVGVDEKYIPDDEKYVDNSVNDEIKGMVNDGIKSAKNYVSDKDNQEKIKKVGKKGFKILKGAGIGYLIFIGLIFLVTIIVFIVIFSSFFKSKKESEKAYDKSVDIINDVIDKANDTKSSYDVSAFNMDLENYNGTIYGTRVKSLLDNVVTKIKKNDEHKIEVNWNNKTITDSNEIVSLKKEFDNLSEYEVNFDYDSDGFINKVTISAY